MTRSAADQAQPPAPGAGPRRAYLIDRTARKVVQIGFLLLFLYPFWPAVYSRAANQPAPALASWLLPWDPLLLLGHLAHRNWSVVVLSAPLLLLALTSVLGRCFCGWVCPMGTVLDLVRGAEDALLRLAHPRSPHRPRKAKRPGPVPWFPANANSPAKYILLAAVVLGAVLSLQALGALDPLVIFHRATTVITADVLALQKPLLRIYLTASLIFLVIILLETWQPRFWCRHLCPLGALLNLTARWSLLNRRVGASCNSCGDCRRACPMQAIPKDGHDTRYGDCTMCLSCEAACPRGAISFGFGGLAGKHWQPEGKTVGPNGRPQLQGRYVANPRAARDLVFSRRAFMAGAAALAAGLALPLGLQAAATRQAPVIRPPGALPEAEFLRTCILCQECVRICPTSAIRPTSLAGNLAGIGTPQLVPRQGGCLLNTSCAQLCAGVCPAGAIQKILPEQMKVGLARVDRAACLAWDQGAKCLVCVEACPTGAAQPFNGRVTVDPQTCSGCGRCEQTCPVADGAIHILPLA